MMVRVIRILIVASALVVGIYSGGTVMTTRLFAPTFTDAERGYVTWWQSTNKDMETRGPMLVLSMLALTAVTGIMLASRLAKSRRVGGRESPLPLAAVAVAFVCVLVDFALTIRVLLPMNIQANEWNPEAPPPGWQTLRSRWLVAHSIRATSSTLALAALLTAAVSRPAASPPHQPS